jgi:uncharacterized DUF497 family protein
MERIELIIVELIWDDWNTDHIARHALFPEQVEEALRDENAVFLKAKQGRVMALGRAGARLIASVLNAQETEGLYYVITARDMVKKERAYYRAQMEIDHE